jgi:hypothetical protein
VEEANKAPLAKAVDQSAVAQGKLPVTSWVRKRRKAPTPMPTLPYLKGRRVRNPIPWRQREPVVVLHRITALEMVRAGYKDKVIIVTATVKKLTSDHDFYIIYIIDLTFSYHQIPIFVSNLEFSILS